MLIMAVDEETFIGKMSEFFSYEACKALFRHYDEEWGQSAFDPKGIAMEWTEYGSVEEAIFDLYERYECPFENLNMDDLSVHSMYELQSELSVYCRYVMCSNGHVLVANE